MGKKVGYGSPPVRSRFRKGQSGNPSGRPAGRRNFRTDLAAELRERVIVTDGGKKIEVTKQRALVKQLIKLASEGNARALGAILDLSRQTHDVRNLADERQDHIIAQTYKGEES